MVLITIQQARDHCKADSDDDAMLTIYANAAEKAVAKLVNRNLYPDAPAMAAARQAIPAALTVALAEYDAAITAAEALEDEREEAFAKEMAEAALAEVKLDHVNTIYGMVATDDLIAAVLLTLGHLRVNKESVAVGPSMGAIEVPMGVYPLCWPHRRLGSL